MNTRHLIQLKSIETHLTHSLNVLRISKSNPDALELTIQSITGLRDWLHGRIKSETDSIAQQTSKIH